MLAALSVLPSGSAIAPGRVAEASKTNALVSTENGDHQGLCEVFGILATSLEFVPSTSKLHSELIVYLRKGENHLYHCEQ